MITLEELYEAKEICNKIKDGNKIILEGKNDILLTTSMYSGDIFYKDILDIDLKEKDYFKFCALNIEFYNYLDAYLYLMNKKRGANIVVDYLNCDYEKLYLNGDLEDLNFNNLCAFNLYNDETIKKFIKDKNIDALFHFVNAGRITPFDFSISERISSFSYLGLTGISKAFNNYLEGKNIKYRYEYGWRPGIKEFKEYGYRFVDDVILYNDPLLKKEILTNNKWSRDKIWPRTVEFYFSPTDVKLDKRIEIFNLVEEYLQYVENELSEKGMLDALEPMKKRKILLP